MQILAKPSSIVKQIWGRSDVMLFIFAGAAAEFALNREVDWLYFTGQLPADPLARLFSTVRYSQQIIFNDEAGAIAAIDRINGIHSAVQSSRKQQIPAAAFHDVLSMLIFYSICSFELLERKLSEPEKDELVLTFREVGSRMHLEDMPGTYSEWSQRYLNRLPQRLQYSAFTADLFRQYRKHLGSFRYFVLLETQRVLVSPQVNKLLGLGRAMLIRSFLPLYRLLRKFRLHQPLILLMVPRRFRQQVKAMNRS